MNRAQRRAAMRAQGDRSKQMLATYSRDRMIESLLQNGITPKQLEAEFERGRLAGFEESSVTIIKSCYAAICLALQEKFGFTKEQCWEAVHAVDEKVIYSIDHAELIDEVLKKIGLTLNFDETFDRIGREDVE